MTAASFANVNRFLTADKWSHHIKWRWRRRLGKEERKKERGGGKRQREGLRGAGIDGIINLHLSASHCHSFRRCSTRSFGVVFYLLCLPWSEEASISAQESEERCQMESRKSKGTFRLSLMICLQTPIRGWPAALLSCTSQFSLPTKACFA